MITLARNPHLNVEIRNNIAVIWLDQQDSVVNTISPELILAFAKVVDEIEKNDSIHGVVLISGKKDFIAGADVSRFLKMAPEEAAESGMIGHGILNRIASSRKNYISAIHGACLGAGLEIALACHGRIATNEKTTCFGLPEVKIGLIPGGGGTQRLPRLIGISPALDMMLSGRNVYVHEASRLGLTDIVCNREQLADAAIQMAKKSRIRRKSKLSFSRKFIELLPATRALIFQKAREKVMEQTLGNYPAPLRIIECVETGFRSGQRRGAQMEIRVFEELVQSHTARQLMQIFFAMTEMKKNPFSTPARPVKQIGIIGAGRIGGDIGIMNALKGFETRVMDISTTALGRFSDRFRSALSQKINKRAISASEADSNARNVTVDTDYNIFASADIVIETATEDLALKQRLLRETETVIPSHCIYATGTSALSVSEIAGKSRRPSQVAGVNYFFPVRDTVLLEIITTDQTSDSTLAALYEMGISQGKTCIVVKDGPGFYTNRILAAMFSEAIRLLEEGGDISKIDFVLQKFGFPVGPFTLMDKLGLDILNNANSGKIHELFVLRGGNSCTGLEKMVDAGFLGRKNNKGFYLYQIGKDGKKEKGEVNRQVYPLFNHKNRRAFSSIRIQHRVALRMLNEAGFCLGEGIIRSPRDGDMGAVFGPGWPAFLGGPFRYADSMGIPKILHMLRELEEDFGSRFKPAPIFSELAEQGLRFY
ncbi:MAG: 3-hydroxyacyl-CoA dehydrogenase NAD-binding domain-containing protein [Bacteroidia bacterium]